MRWLNRLSAIALSTTIATVALFSAANAASVEAPEGTKELTVQLIGRYQSNADFAEGGAEIVVYEPVKKRAYSVNGFSRALDILDLSSLHKGDNTVQDIPLYKRIPLTELADDLKKVSDITSVAVNPDGSYIAVAVAADPKTDPGYIVFLDVDGNYINHVTVGALPDMVTFTPDGKKVLVANEGEPDNEYTSDPVGSVSIIEVSGGIQYVTSSNVTTAQFDDHVQIDDNVRVVKPGATQAQDFEPEYIAVSPDSQWAFVALQEANAIAKLDLSKGQFTQVYSLGLKDHSLQNNGLDPSDKDGQINIRTWPVLGMYMPDGITLFSQNGKNYILTPNEGDSKDYDGFSEEVRVKKIKDQYELKADHYAGYTQEELDDMVAGGLFEDEQLGRLKTTTSMPVNESGKYEAIYAYGARSFSIWDAEDMTKVYDSGSDFERIIAARMPQHFNSSNDENGFDSRSDDKGPEPETIVTGTVNGKDYAFIGLERMSGIMIYDLSDVSKPVFVDYVHSRDFSGEIPGGDVAPEGLTFVPADHSPTGHPLLLTGNEVSGTVAVYEITTSAANTPVANGTDIALRDTVKSLNGSISWNGGTKEVTVRLNGKTAIFTIGSTTAVINGMNISLKEAPYLKDNKTYLPASVWQQFEHNLK